MSAYDCTCHLTEDTPSYAATPRTLGQGYTQGAISPDASDENLVLLQDGDIRRIELDTGV